MARIFSTILGIIHSQSDGLLRYIKPLVRNPSLMGLLSQFCKIRLYGMRRWKRSVTLEHHIEQGLDMHQLMLEANPYSSTNVSRNLVLAIFVQVLKTRSDPVLVDHDLLNQRPFIR